MARKIAPLFPSTDELLRQLGDRLRLTRLRRKLSAKRVAARAGMAPMTLRSLERGGSGVTIGAYLAVMQVLGIEEDLNLVARADPVGHSLQDARLSRRSRVGAPLPDELSRSSVRKVVAASVAAAAGAADPPDRSVDDSGEQWLEDDGFASSKSGGRID